MFYKILLQKLRRGLCSLKLIDLSRGFFYLFIGLLPFQIKTLFFSGGAFYGSGFFNPYLSFFLYLGDVCLILSLLLFGIYFVLEKTDKEKTFEISDLWLLVFVGMFLVFYFSSLIVSVNKVNTFFYLLRFFEFFIVYLLVSHDFVKIKKLIYVFIGSVTIAALIGILQYIFQHSLGLTFLGEPIISSETVGVAKVAFMDYSVLRSYGTFSHPNVFAGYLLFAIFFCIYYWKTEKQIFTCLLVILGAALILTFSRSAFLALFVSLVLYYSLAKIRLSWKYLIGILFVVGLFIVLFNLSPVLISRFLIGDANSLNERGLFYDIGKKMFLDNWFGIGAGNFTQAMQTYVDVKILPWQFQPVHNIFVLVLNEIGIWGFAAFSGLFIYIGFYLLKLMKKENIDKRFVAILLALLLAIVVIGLFDHYFISLYQGQALFWLYLGLISYVGLNKKELA
jgi:O-antigen ligase